MSIRIKVHPEKCIGAGHCVVSAGDVFSQNDDDGVVVLLNEAPSAARRDAVKAAARLCPTGAIEVIEQSLTEEQK
jgi:ferredoxin